MRVTPKRILNVFQLQGHIPCYEVSFYFSQFIVVRLVGVKGTTFQF